MTRLFSNFEEAMDFKDWWSVCSVNARPYRYRLDLSTAHTIARHSRSNVAYARRALFNFLLT